MYVILQRQKEVNKKTMKTTQFIFLAASTFTFCFFIAAETNYLLMTQAAANSCGSDSCISEALVMHGFKPDIFADITTLDKAKALFNL